MNKNISVVIPVLNEEGSISDLITALNEQTLNPREVVLVDGGSTDQTLQVLESIAQSKLNFNLIVLKESGTNRSQARNRGIEQANSEIIALTDAGCIPKSDWLEKLTAPFAEKQVEVVAGFYDPAPANFVENLFADYTCTREWQFSADSFLPSSRSIAFRKNVWQEVGGYPEELETCEDLVFAEKLKAATEGWRVVKDAHVIWKQPKNLGQLADKIFNYALGDLQAGYQRHVAKIHAAKWRVIILLAVAIPCFFIDIYLAKVLGLVLFGLYWLGSLYKHPRHLVNPLNWFLIPIVQLRVDIALVQALIYHYLSKSSTPGQ